jgi:hypothetical protein
MTTWILVLSMTRLSLAALTALWAARKIMWRGRIADLKFEISKGDEEAGLSNDSV